MLEDLVKIAICVGLTLGLLLVELILGHFSHCLTLLALTNQTFYNLLTFCFILAAKALKNRTNDLKTTFGWARLEVVGSLGSLIFLGSLSFATSIECLQTLFHSGHLDEMHHSFYLCILATAHFIVWILVFLLAGGYSYQQTVTYVLSNAGPVLLHTSSSKDRENQYQACNLSHMYQVPFKNIFRDLYGCFLLFVVSFISYACGNGYIDIPKLKYIDPSVSLLTIAIMILSSLGLAKESGLILLQTIPDMLDVNELKKELLINFPDILDIHDVHIWCLVPGNVIVTMHVKFRNEENFSKVFDSLEKHLSRRGATSFTIQPEFVSNEENNEEEEEICNVTTCLLRCKQGENFCKSCC